MKIALVLLTDADTSQQDQPEWSAGPVVLSSEAELGEAVDRAIAPNPQIEQEPGPELVLIWDAALALPSPETLRALVNEPRQVDVWHGGLALGQGARPALLDTVHPTWMLAADPPADIDATSWRLSLRACLLRAHVWRQLGGADSSYRSLTGRALELGHRWLWGGAVLRHAPRLVPADAAPDPSPPIEDEMRFLVQRAGRFWAIWALARGVLSGRLPLSAIGNLRQQLGAASPRLGVAKLERPLEDGATTSATELSDIEPATKPVADRLETVTVLIPTLDRYPYLRVVLEQLETQSVPPSQVIVIDQTAPGRRQRDWHDRPALPLIVIERDEPGQSSARNAGLHRANGDVVLFLDDDVEMDKDLIARHLEVLHSTGADASCGVMEEVGAGELPPDFRFDRVSDVFPTCNAALRRSAIRGSGLFDLAFDRGARADADFGTRLYLSGALLRLSPEISVLHHKAPAGGLRQHKARVATYAASRRSLVRHLPSVTEIYLALRYGSAREMLWQRAVATLRARGGGRSAMKLLWGAALMPDTLIRIASRARRARRMLRDYPQIPPLPESPENADAGDAAA